MTVTFSGWDELRTDHLHQGGGEERDTCSPYFMAPAFLSWSFAHMLILTLILKGSHSHHLLFTDKGMQIQKCQVAVQGHTASMCQHSELAPEHVLCPLVIPVLDGKRHLGKAGQAEGWRPRGAAGGCARQGCSSPGKLRRGRSTHSFNLLISWDGALV